MWEAFTERGMRGLVALCCIRVARKLSLPGPGDLHAGEFDRMLASELCGGAVRPAGESRNDVEGWVDWEGGG